MCGSPVKVNLPAGDTTDASTWNSTLVSSLRTMWARPKISQRQIRGRFTRFVAGRMSSKVPSLRHLVALKLFPCLRLRASRVCAALVCSIGGAFARSSAERIVRACPAFPCCGHPLGTWAVPVVSFGPLDGSHAAEASPCKEERPRRARYVCTCWSTSHCTSLLGHLSVHRRWSYARAGHAPVGLAIGSHATVAGTPSPTDCRQGGLGRRIAVMTAALCSASSGVQLSLTYSAPPGRLGAHRHVGSIRSMVG